MEKRGKRKGQIDISFGFIFGIIIIVVVIATAFYVISHFLSLSRCTDTGLFYSDLQDEIDKAWAGSITSQTFTGNLPSNIQSVCFGGLNQMPLSDSRTQYESLVRFKSLDKNVFLYPYEKACNPQLANHQLEHVKTNQFFCVDVKDSKASLKISKNVTDALVTLSK